MEKHLTREGEKKHIILGSRESALAMAQTRIAADVITACHPEYAVEILPMKTTGDRILDRPLEEIGGKGLFVKELDRALAQCRTDFSVHSLKDMPVEDNADFPVAAYLKREDPRDALVLPEGASVWNTDLPVGTGSKRRIYQLQALCPDLKFAPLRGNILTRLKKLDEGQYGAVILAAAGMKRMGLAHRISRYFSTDEMVPAAGQGILALQGRRDTEPAFFEGINDPDTARAAICERAFVRALGCGCTEPAGAFAEVSGDEIRLTGIWFSPDGTPYRTGMTMTCRTAEECEALGIKAAKSLQIRTK